MALWCQKPIFNTTLRYTQKDMFNMFSFNIAVLVCREGGGSVPRAGGRVHYWQCRHCPGTGASLRLRQLPLTTASLVPSRWLLRDAVMREDIWREETHGGRELWEIEQNEQKDNE